MALPEFDRFWSRVAESGILVGMHGSDSGYQRYQNEWEGVRDGEMLPFQRTSAFSKVLFRMHRPIVDTVTSLIGHGLCSRFPDFDEDPIKVFKRNIYIHPFHEEDPIGLVELLGADRVLFGSDYPHPEGMSDPLSFVDELQALDESAIRKVMGGNLAGLMHVREAA